jgi:pimeloyl-ACP methyl ester carboxylesterase
MHFMTFMTIRVAAVLVVLTTSLATFAAAAEQPITIDHYVLVHSTVPAIQGQIAPVYVREVTLPGTVASNSVPGDKIVLLVHGASPPSEVAFDLNYQDYSWMGALARAGFDVFAMDMTGYGRSTRPAAMNDPCNLSKPQQLSLVPSVIAEPCPASYGMQMTTIASDWNDIGAVVDHLLALRHVEKLNIAAWSMGGMRAASWAGQHQDKVLRMVLIAPAYNRATKAEPPAQVPANGPAMNTLTQAEFMDGWNRQAGCPNQIDPAASEAVWRALQDSDPMGATWGAGVRRAPQETVWGWTQALASATKIPTMLLSGATDKTVPPDRVRELYADLGAAQKVFVDLACSSHNAIWERNHLLLFQASVEWLARGTVNGLEQGVVKLGY